MCLVLMEFENFHINKIYVIFYFDIFNIYNLFLQNTYSYV